jgi:ABC-2 type transport system ATP-binding protein
MDQAMQPNAGAAGAAEPAIRFAGVAKRYRGRPVLRDVGFDVPEGASVALVGVNGAGKSTLLQCLLDFAPLDAGQIGIRGRDHRDIAAREALAWMPERFAPPAHRSARECLHWLAGLRGLELDDTRVAPLACALGLDGRVLEMPVRELSKGMTQKLGLMAIGLSACPIWVLDEPMSGLDPLARRAVARLIDTARQERRTVLFTAHGLRELPQLCDRLVVLHEGALRFCGTPQSFAACYGDADLEQAFLTCIDAGCDDRCREAPAECTA